MTEHLPQTRYVTLLPEVLRERAAHDQRPVIDGLVGIIEELIGGFHTRLHPITDRVNPARTLDTIADLVDPRITPPDFLPWLASWVALVLRTDWDEQKQREVLARIIPLYRKRGTKAGLEEYLEIYVGDGVSIVDEQDGYEAFQIGITSTVGVKTLVGGFPANLFLVNLKFTTADPEELSKKAESVKAVLDIEKPAHTDYRLTLSGPTFRIGYQSTIGTDTLI